MSTNNTTPNFRMHHQAQAACIIKHKPRRWFVEEILEHESYQTVERKLPFLFYQQFTYNIQEKL